MNKLTTKISHDELMCAYAPLMDLSIAMDDIVASTGTGSAGKIIEFFDGKVKRAMIPLKECLDRIQEENPGQFT